MAAVNKTTVFITGKLYWAKVLGNPVYNKFNDNNEWAFELEPDAAGVATLKKLGLSDRLKDKYEDRGRFISLRKTELAKDGSPNAPIRVYNADNEPWDQKALIGNASVGDVKLDVRDYGPTKKKGVYPVAIRVTEHVEYQSSEFGGMDGPAGATGNETPAKGRAKAKAEFADDLNDDVPF